MTPDILQRIKEYARINQQLTEEYMIVAEHPYMAVSNPWIDESGRFELKNIEAVKEWGLVTVLDFCEKVKDKLENEPLFTAIIEKFFSLDSDSLDDLKEHMRRLDGELTLERITELYAKAHTYYNVEEVKNLLDSDEASLDTCKAALERMYEEMKGGRS